MPVKKDVLMLNSCIKQTIKSYKLVILCNVSLTECFKLLDSVQKEWFQVQPKSESQSQTKVWMPCQDITA